MSNEFPYTTPTSISALTSDDGVSTLLVDVAPGSKLDVRLTEIERKLDQILGILGVEKAKNKTLWDEG
jgi:hypothetical protein